MNILFVCSGTRMGKRPGTIVANQAKDLFAAGVQVSFYLITRKGFAGYLAAIVGLRKHLRNNRYDVVHAHFSLSAYVATLAGADPLVVSLMGSDVHTTPLGSRVLRMFARRWQTIIVKSAEMKNKCRLNNALVIPNGVDLGRFAPENRDTARTLVGWSAHPKKILFMANPARREKNFELANAAVALLPNGIADLKTVFDIPHSQTRHYFYASDVVIMTSLYEGSPNVIKEAMACNCVVVSTDVGDVRELFGDLPEMFISKSDAQSFSANLASALEYSGPTTGRQRLTELSLDSVSVAKKLTTVYRNIIDARK